MCISLLVICCRSNRYATVVDCHKKKLTEMLDYGVITPSAMTILDHEALYETDCVRKVHIAMRLCRDLELNMAGAALAIELLDEINSLRERLQID